MMQEFRRDMLTAQKVGIGVIYKQMLGSDDARAYLNAENIPEPVIERVLSGTTRSAGQECPAVPPLVAAFDPQKVFYCGSGRRRDMVKAAIVEAALAVRAQLGRERAENLLRREGLPDDVIDRVLAANGVRRAR